MPFDVAEALKAGYSQQEIAKFLGEQKKFDTQKAFESGYSPDEVISFLNPKEQTTGERLKRAAAKGFEAIPESAAGIGLGVSSALGLESTGRQAEAIRKEAKKEAELPQGITWDELEKTYGTEGAFAALKKFPTYVAEQILQSAPSMAIPLAAGAAGAAVSGPLAPIVGPIAGIGAYGVQQFGQFMQRQAQEGATPETLAPGKAALAAAATAPIGYFADRFTLGMSKVPTKVIGEELSKELAKRTSGVAGRAVTGASLGIIAEAPTEVLEQAAERWQAGLDLTSEDAKKEYKEAFFGAAAVGGVGGAAARVIKGAPPEPEVAPPPAIPPSPVAEPSLTGTAPAEMIAALSRPQNADMMAAIRGREAEQEAQAEAQRVEEERAAAEVKRLDEEAQRVETARQMSERERVRAMPGFTGADTTNAGILQAQREKEEAEAVALEKGKEIEYRKILGTIFSSDPLQNFRQQQAAIERLDYTTPEMKKQIPDIYDQLKVLSEEPEAPPVTPTVTTVTPPVTPAAPVVEPIAAPVAPVVEPIAPVAPPVAPPAAPPVAPVDAPVAPPVAAPIAPPIAPPVAKKADREPTEIQKREAFGKAIGAARPYRGSIEARANLPAQTAAKEGNFEGVVNALSKSKNATVVEVANKAKGLGTKIAIDNDATETYEAQDVLARQDAIDSAKMHMGALEKIRELATQVDALPDGAPLKYDVIYQKVPVTSGEYSGSLDLGDIAKEGSWLGNLQSGPIKLKTKEDFKKLQNDFEELTQSIGEDKIRLTSTGSAKVLGVAGVYDTNTDTIRVPEYFAKNEGVLAHEIIHAQVSKSIASPTIRQKPVVVRLKNLYEYVKNYEAENKVAGERKPYGLESIQEFIAEGLSNPRFQYYLQEIEYENSTVWSKFTKAIADLLGIKHGTAFTELLTIYDELTPAKKPKPAFVKKEEKIVPPEITEMEKQLRSVQVQARGVKSASLWTALKGTLSQIEVRDISPDKSVKGLQMAPSKGNGAVLSDIVADGNLDDFLPPSNRHKSPSFDESDATEYIKEKIRNKNYLTFQAEMEVASLGVTIEELETAINEYFTQEELNLEIQQTIDEQREANSEAKATELEDQARAIEADEAEVLREQTPAELKSKEERAKSEEKRIAAEKKAAEDKAKADAEIGEYKLAGSDRAADQDSDQDQMFSVGADEDKNSADLFDYIKDFDSALDAINKYASNDAQKEIANIVTTRINQLKKLGFKFSLGITKDGYSLNNGARGVSVITYSGLGESTSVKITLNHPSNGNQSGTRWKTVAHEIAHAATQAQIKFAPKGSAAEKLNNLYNDVIKHFNDRVKQKNLTAFEKKIYDRQYNALLDPDELLAWGLTNEEMQKWLNGIKSKNGSFLSRLFDVVANALGISENNTALSELLSISENLLTEVTDTYIEAASKRGKSFGLQQNKTKYPSWALSLADGRNIVWNEKDAALVETKSINGNKLYLLATPSGITRVGVDSYAGDMLSPARLKEVQSKAKELNKVVVKFDDKGQGQMFSLRGKSAQQLNVFQETLRNLLNKFGLKDVGVNLIEGMKDEGSYAAKVIQVAADSANPIRTLRHEAIHALRELGFFSESQWKSLSNMAKNKWIDQYLKQRNVDGKPLKAGEESRYNAYMREYKGDMEKITEEAVADAFADFDANKAPAGMLQAVLKRLSNLFQSIKSALTKMESAEQIFGKVEKGALKPEGEQVKGEAKSLRDRATANFNRWFGDSKVVDEKGEPLVMYHGTKENFKSFKKSGVIFSSPESNFASAIAGKSLGSNVIPVYIKSENPFDYENLEHLRKLDALKISIPSDLLKKGSWLFLEKPEVIAAIKSMGFDGLYVKESGVKNLGVFEPTQIKSAIGNNGDYSLTNVDISKSLRSVAGKAKEKAQKFLQKREPINAEALSDVDPAYIEQLGKVFNPKNQTVIDKIDGMKDGFFRRVAQGVADQYRTIKDYDPKSYMLARLSKTQDGALEGLMFHGHVFNDGGALNIKQNTKGLIEALKPVGKETDRYQMWVAVNREARLPPEKRSPNISALIPEMDQLSQGTIDGKPRLEVYKSVQRDMNAINKSVLDVALNAGIINSSKKDIAAIQARTDLTDEQKQKKIDKINRPSKEEIERIMSRTDLTDEQKQKKIRENRQGAYEIFSKDIFYIPFYKQMEDGDIESAASASGLDRQKFSAELKGMNDKPFGDLMENTLRNWSHILSASMKNQAADSTIKVTMEAGATIPNLKAGLRYEDGVVVSSETGNVVGDGELRPDQTEPKKGMVDMVKIMRDGHPMYFEVLDPMLLESITSIGYMGPKSKFLDVARDFKNLLQFGVTISPTFKVNNLIRDSISAMAVSNLKKNPFANIVEGWGLSKKNDPAHISALAGGAVFNFGSTYEGDQARLVKQLLKKGVSPDSILDSPDKIKNGLKLLWDKYQELGNRSEAANRLALYQQMRDKGMSHMEASFQARDLLDFSMQGSWQAFRVVTMVVPFLNARVQGLYKLGRDGIVPTSRVMYNTITGKEITASDRQKAFSFGVTTAAVSLASMALYMAFKDDEDFQKRDEWDRDNFWWIKLPNMDYALRVPKPFEIGAFGTLSERILEQIIDQGSEGKQFGSSIGRMLFDTFALNPTPQMFKPLIDLYANKDSFTGAPIESAGMERLSKQERATDTTSPIAKLVGGMSSFLGEKGELSPVQVDYAIKSYFGWLGATAATTSMYATMPFREGAYPDTVWMDKASLGLVKTLPSNQSRYTTAFYESNKEISQAFADMRHFAEAGESEKVEKILEEKGDKIALSKFYDKTAKSMANIRKQIRIVTNDESMSGAEKREEVDRLKEIISMLAQQAEDTRKSMK